LQLKITNSEATTALKRVWVPFCAEAMDYLRVKFNVMDATKTTLISNPDIVGDNVDAFLNQNKRKKHSE